MICSSVCRLLFGFLRFVKCCIVTIFLFTYGSLKFCMPYCCRREKSLKDKIILITGTGSGIGRELAIQLGRFQPILVLWSRLQSNNEVTANLVKEKYPLFADKLRIFTFAVDVGNTEQVRRAAKTVEEEIGPVDILINNAGTVHGRLLIHLEESQIEHTIKTNLMAHFWTIKAFLPSMIDRNSGHIVAMSSVTGLVGTSHLTDYSASKFAIMGLMEALDVELQNLNKKNVRLTTICPFFVNTGMFEGIRTQ